MRVPATVVTLLLLLVVQWPVPVAAQQDPRVELEALVERLALAWEGGEVEGLAAGMHRDGILLHLPDAVHPGLSIRMARSALKDLHERAGSGPVQVDRVRLLGGVPARASVEFRWHPLPPGMSNPMGYTVFMGFQRTPEGWRISEIRILGGASETLLVPEPPTPCP